jgi:hypothetical protein|tara:strand:- start:244 stop:459 length:216 start_codon:yes stop_codon:yes gene_type:complete
MYIKDLQNILDEFTEGKKGNDIKHAKIYVSLSPSNIAEIKKMEVQANNIIGSKEGIRVVLFPATDKPKLIL